MLVGREPELLVLRDALAGTASGLGSTLLIEGEAGIGKTRLIDHLIDLARRDGMTVLRGDAHPLGRTRPFGAIADALGLRPRSADPRRAEIGRWLVAGSSPDEEDSGGAPRDLRFRVVEAILDLVEACSAQAPTLLVIEDLHWADASTLLTFDHLRRELADVPLLLAGSLRPSPRSPELDEFLDAAAGDTVRSIRLRPLTRDEVDDLVDAELGLAPGPTLAAVVDKAAGNPLFIVEILRSLQAERRLERGPTVADIATQDLPDSLRGLVIRRMRYLPSETLDLLRITAVLGDAVAIRDLATMAHRSTADVIIALDEAFRAQLLDEQPDTLTFRHQLVHDAIYEDIPGAIRRALHRDAATELAAAGADPSQVASHLIRGAVTGDMDAVRQLRRAARDAVARAPMIAVDLLRRAEWLVPPGNEEADNIAADLVEALFRAGRVAEAADLAESVLGRPHAPDVDRPVRLCLADALSVQNRTSELVRFADQMLEQPGSMALQDQSFVLAQASYGRTLSGDLVGGELTAERALALAEQSGDAAMMAWSLSALSVPTKAQGRYSEALTLTRRAVAFAAGPRGSEVRLRHPYFFHGMALADADRFDEARTAFRQAVVDCRELGSTWILSDVLMMAAELRFLAGEWDDASAELDASLEMAAENGTTILIVRSRALQAIMATAKGDLRGAEAAIDGLSAELERDETGWSVELVACAAAALAEARGESRRAFEILSSALDRDERREDRYWHRHLAPPLVRLAMDLGDTALARRVAGAVEAGANLTPDVDSLRATALRVRGIAERDPDLMVEAVEVSRRSPRVVDAAGTAEDAATVLIGAGRTGDATDLLLDANDRYEEVGAQAWAARVAAELRRLGVRRGVRGPRGRPAFGWDSLTTTERGVAELVAQGLTNREVARRLYVSPHTVNTHLRHVFTKLDVSSRAALAAEAQRRSHAATGMKA
jgi:DNA-binding CsgD family transcriptional regulator/tetratricopeptide (TPR) repeat protein